MPQQPLPAKFAGCPTTADVQRIAALPDPVVRNLQITQCYHELSSAMANLTGRGANWCTVATWASRQAGQSIRNEDLRRTFERLLSGSRSAADAARTLAATGQEFGGDETRSLAGAVDALRDALSPAAAFERTSAAIARGNRKVFEEIGYHFARFLALFDQGPPGPDLPDSFCREFQAGDPPEGQRYLRQAFTHYRQAIAAENDKARSEWLLLANLEIGFHEQTRLQPDIVEALEAPVYDPRQLRRQLVAELFPDPRSRLRYLVARVAGRARPLIQARDALADEARRLGRLAITEHLMTLALPGGRLLRLGQDLPDAIPANLRVLENPELAALIRRVDAAPETSAASGAQDWGDLADRMNFIAELFRTFHDDASLFAPPFSAEQLVDIRDGKRPAGRL